MLAWQSQTRHKDTVAKGEDGKCLPQNSKHFFHFFQLDRIHETDGVVENVQLQQASKTEPKKVHKSATKQMAALLNPVIF